MTTLRTLVSRTIPIRFSPILTYVVVALASFAVGIFAVVFFAHLAGWSGDWQHASQVGDFLGGHMAVLALVFVTLGLLLQERALREQIREMQSTVSIMVSDVEQKNLQFMLDHIRETARNMRATALVPKNPDGTGVTESKVLVGLDEITRHLREASTGSAGIDVFTYHRDVKNYLDHVKRAKRLLADLRKTEAAAAGVDSADLETPSPQLEVHENIVASFFPPVLDRYIEDHEAEVDRVLEEVLECTSEETRDRVGACLGDGWHLRLWQKGGGWAGKLLRLRADGTFDEPSSVDTGGLKKGHVVQLLLDKI
jgi:hypothetical protein